MAQTTTTRRTQSAPPPPQSTQQAQGALTVLRPPRLQMPKGFREAFGLDGGAWRVLVESVWPGAKTPESVAMAVRYCKIRGLDPFKRVVHIVPIWDSEKKKYVESVWPGIAELRTTAFRTRQYAGADETTFGPMREHTFEDEVGYQDKARRERITVRFPEWAQITVYRYTSRGQRVAYPGPRVHWMEVYSAIGRSILPNAKWQKSPSQMLEKCAEAAALRKAFPEELGGELAAEEISEQRTTTETIPATRPTADSVQREMDEAAATTPSEDHVDDDGYQDEGRQEDQGEEQTLGFAVVGVDGTIAWAGGDAANYTSIMINTMLVAKDGAALVTLAANNKEDMARLSPELRQKINDAMNQKLAQGRAADSTSAP